MRHRFAGDFYRPLNLHKNFGHPFPSVCSAKPRFRNYQFSQIGFVCRREISLPKGMSKNACGLRAHRSITAVWTGMIRTEQRIDKILVRIKVLTSWQICYRPVPARARKRSCPLCRTNYGGGCGGQKRCGDYDSYSPHQKSMRGITKIHFVRMNSGPFRAQSACEIATHSRSDDLDNDQPEDGGVVDGRGRCANVRPWRDGG